MLGLMPSPEPVVIGEHSYLGLLVPSAPVPFGGALIYVPSEWVRPAEGGVERLMNVLRVDGRDAAAFASQTGQARAG